MASSATRIQDKGTQLRASVVPIIGHPTINGLVICDADGNPINIGGTGPRTDYGAYISQTTPATPVYIGDYTGFNVTNFDEVGYQTMVKDARPWGFVSYDFCPITGNKVEYMLPTPEARLGLGGANEFLPYYVFPKYPERYTYLPFELIVPEDYSEIGDYDNGELYWYVNFTIDETSREARGRNAKFGIIISYANQQVICDEAFGNRENRESLSLDSCRMDGDIIIGGGFYRVRDDLTTPETSGWIPTSATIRPFMKIRGVLFRDTEGDDWDGNVIPLQVGFRYRKNRIGTKYPRSNTYYSAVRNPINSQTK